MEARKFSFTELEQRVAVIPDGPASVLNRPQWQYWADIGGGVGVIIGLLASLFAELFEPKWWMVIMIRIGLGTMILFFLPGFLRSLYVIAYTIWRGKKDDTAQLDHDFSEMNSLQTWLTTFPRQALEQHLRFVQVVQTRLAAKLSLMGGDLDRFGILPLILAVAVQIKAFTSESMGVPLWQIVPGLFFAIGYLVGLRGAFMRVRMHLYETVLAEALERRAPPDKPGRTT
jgi:hypothetical protein